MALSYSQLGTYRRCPKQYEFANVKKIPRSITDGESFGSSIHHTLKRFGELEMRLQEPLRKKQQLTLFADEHTALPQPRTADLTALLGFYRECFIAEGYDDNAAMNTAFKRGEATLRRFFDWWREKKRTVIGIEFGFKLSLPRASADSLLLSGRFDRIEQSADELHIIDYKTSSPKTQENVDADLQLSIYALAAEQKWHPQRMRLSLLFLSPEGCIERSTVRSANDLLRATTAITEAAARMERQEFQATPSQNVCGSCPYRGICNDAAG